VISDGQGGPRGGPWGVFVEKDGVYEMALRRWPAELDLPLNAGCPEKVITMAKLKAGKALPIAGAKLRIGDEELSTKTEPGDRAARFRVPLKGGARARLQGWFQDAGGQDLCGAYVAEVRRL